MLRADETTDDGLYAALEALDRRPPPLDVRRAVTGMRARGLGHECDTLLSHSDAGWQQLRDLIAVVRRLDPSWCALHDDEQPSDEELDLAIGTAEEALDEHDMETRP